MWPRSLLAAAAFAACSSAVGASNAQTIGGNFYDPYTIYANTTQGALTFQQGGANEITGQVLGDRLSGYYASGARQAVWIRWNGATPRQVYVGQFNRGVGAQGGSLNGVFYAVSAAGSGASAQRNAWGFRAWQARAPQRVPPVPNTNPPTGVALDAAGAWWTRANTSESPLVVNIAANGDVTGWIFGDRITGHHASAAGTIAFLRWRNNQPIQFFHGTATPAGQAVELSGVFHALNESAGGASTADNEFDFRAANHRDFKAYRLLDTGLCLEFASGAVNDGAQLRQGTCTGGDNQQLAHLRMFNAQRVMVARHSGRCLDIPNASGAAGEVVQQFGCHGAQNQQIVHQGVNSNADFNLRFVHSGLCIWLDGTTAGALARQNACSTTDALNLFAF
jgi:hypothetical protein